jgi:hypothetical protein
MYGHHASLVHAYGRGRPRDVLIVESIMDPISGGFSRLGCCAAAYIIGLHSDSGISDGKTFIQSIRLEIALIQTFSSILCLDCAGISETAR